MKRKFIFVSGCARSGTTVLATILNWSDEVLVCQERFAPFLRNFPERFTPELYGRERLLRFQKIECGYTSFEDKKEYFKDYCNAKDFANSDTYAYIGDKITHLYRRFGIFQTQGWEREDIILLHIIRNPVEVALSYQKRALSPTDGWVWNFEHAIEDWMMSVENAYNLQLSTPENVRFAVVDYDAMFNSGPAHCLRFAEGIFRFVGLSFDTKASLGISKVYSNFEAYKAVRFQNNWIRDRVKASIPGEALDKYLQLCEWSQAHFEDRSTVEQGVR